MLKTQQHTGTAEMKKTTLILILGAVIVQTLVAQNAAALDDECTPQLDAYIEGLTVGIMLAREPRLVNNNIQHPERLRVLRKTQPDCAIANTIPGLLGSKADNEENRSLTDAATQSTHGGPAHGGPAR
jgi:hypothetical protein